MASSSLRMRVRLGLRKRFLASCWVMVDPPWEMPRRARLAKSAGTCPRRRPRHANRSAGSSMAMKVCGRRSADHRRQRQEERPLLLISPACCEQVAVEFEDLGRWGGRLVDFEAEWIGGQAAPPDPGDDADAGDHAPNRGDREPIGEASDSRTTARAAAAGSDDARLALGAASPCRRPCHAKARASRRGERPAHRPDRPSRAHGALVGLFLLEPCPVRPASLRRRRQAVRKL